MGWTSMTEARDARPSRMGEAYEAIERMIVTGELRPEAMISEGELMRALDLGRTPVRDALQRLHHEGLVEIRPRRGVVVAPADMVRQLELLEMRRPLEALMVGLAARRATAEQRERMRALALDIEAAVAADDRARYLDINRAIHEIEARASGNRFLERQMGLVHKQSRRFWYSFITDTVSFSEAAAHHARTLRGIAEGGVEDAQRGCEALLDLLEDVTQSALRDRLRKP